jgi:TRAP-type C4-dicarboxylate transport system permease small subunit
MASCVLGAISVVIITMTTVIDVVLRSFFNSGITGSIEIVSAFLTAIVYFGVGYCTIKRGMIIVELFNTPAVIVYINEVLSILMGGVIIYCTTAQAFFSASTGVGSMHLGIPKWPFMMITAFGYLIMSVAMILNLIEDIQNNKAEAAAVRAQKTAATEGGERA